MTIETSLCTIEDVPAMAEISVAAFASSRNRQVLNRGYTEEEKIQFNSKYILELFQQQGNPSLPTRRIVKAVDPTTKEMMGLCIWSYQADGYKKELDWQVRVPKEPTPGKGNFALATDFALKTAHVRGEHPARHHPHWLLDLLCTSPNHERKGVASKLIREGFPDADAKGVPCFVEASMLGHPVYERCGFFDIGEMSVDLDHYESGCGFGVITWKAMMREPRKA